MLTHLDPSEPLYEEAGQYKVLYNMLLESIPSSLLFLDRNIKVVNANTEFLKKTQRSKADTVGRHLSHILPTVILERMPIFDQIREAFLHNTPSKGDKLSYRAPGIPPRIYYYRIIPFPLQNRVELVLLLMDDITEQVHLSQEVRRIESHLASVVESASELILSTDMEARIVSWNRAAEEITGYRFEETQGKYLYQFIPAEDMKKARQTFQELQRKSGPEMAELGFITREGSHLQVAWVFSLLKMNGLSDEDGVVALGRDMTEWRRMERQLTLAHKFASLGVMAGGIAHEIRNPLAISSSAAQFLFEEDIDPQFRQECAQKIFSSLERASRVIENLLSFARSKSQIGVEEIDLVAIIQEALSLTENEAKLQKIEIVFSTSSDSVEISGNQGLLQQVFLNILLNSIKAMPDGGCLRIQVETHWPNVLIRISDTGRGIPEDALGKIFDPFYTTSPVGQGTGLGLSVTYAIVQQHSGSIEVESRKGRGTTFTVTFPLG